MGKNLVCDLMWGYWQCFKTRLSSACPSGLISVVFLDRICHQPRTDVINSAKTRLILVNSSQFTSVRLAELWKFFSHCSVRSVPWFSLHALLYCPIDCQAVS